MEKKKTQQQQVMVSHFREEPCETHTFVVFVLSANNDFVHVDVLLVSTCVETGKGC